MVNSNDPLSSVWCTVSFSCLLVIGIAMVGLSFCWPLTSHSENFMASLTNVLNVLQVVLALAQQWKAMTYVSIAQTYLTLALLVPLVLTELWCGTGGTLRLLRRLLLQHRRSASAIVSRLRRWVGLQGEAEDNDPSGRRERHGSFTEDGMDSDARGTITAAVVEMRQKPKLAHPESLAHTEGIHSIRHCIPPQQSLRLSRPAPLQVD